MKTTVLQKGFILLALIALPVMFAGCEKETVEPSRTGGGDTPDNPQPQKHNVELVYGKSPSTEWQNISFDTINKYNSDPTIDTIFMVPERPTQFSTLTTNQLNICIPKLRERHNVNPNKVFGKGELQLKADAVRDHMEIVRFFADTLKYNITYNDKKSR